MYNEDIILIIAIRFECSTICFKFNAFSCKFEMWGRSPLFLKSAQFVAICRSQVWSGALKRNIAGFLCLERNCWQGEEFRWLTSYQWTWRRSVLRARRKEEGEGGALERTEYFSRIELEYMDERNYFKMNFKKKFCNFEIMYKFSHYLFFMVLFIVYTLHFRVSNFYKINLILKLLYFFR